MTIIWPFLKNYVIFADRIFETSFKKILLDCDGIMVDMRNTILDNTFEDW